MSRDVLTPQRLHVHYGRYPKMRITLREALELDEYSATNPTGVIVGKRWRRCDGAHDREFIRAGGVPHWLIGQYEDCGDPDRCAIRFYRPLIRVKALTARA